MIRSLEKFKKIDPELALQQAIILLLIAANPNSTPVDLADGADTTLASINRAVATLSKGKYVEKHPNPNDGRSHFVELTTKGATLVEDILKEV